MDDQPACHRILICLLLILSGCVHGPKNGDAGGASDAAATPPENNTAHIYWGGSLVRDHACPKGQIAIRFEWHRSPLYNPLIKFFRRPDPVVVCAQWPDGDPFDQEHGRCTTIQAVGVQRLATGGYKAVRHCFRAVRELNH